MLGPEIVVPVAFFASIVVVVIGRPWIKAVAAKAEAEAKNPQLPAELMNRFERMEQSIDAIAVEVERISEGQRFTTKLLSEVRSTAALPPSSAQSDARGT